MPAARYAFVGVRGLGALERVRVNPETLAADIDTAPFVLEQGFEIGRPSRIYLEIGASVRVGGKVQAVAEGRLAPLGPA